MLSVTDFLPPLVNPDKQRPCLNPWAVSGPPLSDTTRLPWCSPFYIDPMPPWACFFCPSGLKILIFTPPSLPRKRPLSPHPLPWIPYLSPHLLPAFWAFWLDDDASEPLYKPWLASKRLGGFGDGGWGPEPHQTGVHRPYKKAGSPKTGEVFQLPWTWPPLQALEGRNAVYLIHVEILSFIID